ncbi:MAG: acetyl-CoA carboxylase biotin carboxyl carrier protein [Magnetococcus sp. XQGC-1]
MDLREIRQLIKMLDGTDISELEVREEAQTVRIVRQPASGLQAVSPVPQPMVSYTPPAAHFFAPPTIQAQRTQEEKAAATNTVTIQSPMVGTYYQANSPDAPPLVAQGDVIKKGQVVCIIEAMKLMNEIESEYAGRVVSILKENATPVEYGEPLFILEPV